MRFITHGSGYTQFVTAQEVVWRLDGKQQDHAVRMSFPGAMLPSGADASAIRLRFAGAQQLEVGSRGELIVRTPAGELPPTQLHSSSRIWIFQGRYVSTNREMACARRRLARNLNSCVAALDVLHKHGEA